jgi:hypothetical protein
MAANSEYPELALELDKESWEWLLDNHPQIADALELQVTRGATPDALRAFVQRRCGVNRVEFARRCEAAARHLITGVKK